MRLHQSLNLCTRIWKPEASTQLPAAHLLLPTSSLMRCGEWQQLVSSKDTCAWLRGKRLPNEELQDLETPFIRSRDSCLHDKRACTGIHVASLHKVSASALHARLKGWAAILMSLEKCSWARITLDLIEYACSGTTFCSETDQSTIAGRMSFSGQTSQSSHC